MGTGKHRAEAAFRIFQRCARRRLLGRSRLPLISLRWRRKFCIGRFEPVFRCSRHSVLSPIRTMGSQAPTPNRQTSASTTDCLMKCASIPAIPVNSLRRGTGTSGKQASSIDFSFQPGGANEEHSDTSCMSCRRNRNAAPVRSGSCSTRQVTRAPPAQVERRHRSSADSDRGGGGIQAKLLALPRRATEFLSADFRHSHSSHASTCIPQRAG